MWGNLHYFYGVVISNTETISNFAVVRALLVTIITFYITYRGNRKSEQIKSIKTFKECYPMKTIND